MLPVDELKILSETGRDGVCQIARLVMAGQEKMIDLNIDALQQLMKKTAGQLEQASHDVAHIGPAGNWRSVLAESGTAINLLALRIGTSLYQDMTKFSFEQGRAVQVGMLEEAGKYTSRAGQVVNAAVSRLPQEMRRAV